MTNHRITTTATVILSFAAAGAPAASARPADFVPANLQAPTSVYSRPDKSMIPVSPPAVSGGAIGRAARLGSLAQRERQRVAALSAYREGQLAASFAVAATAANQASAPQAVVRAHAAEGRFDWGDAGVGAVGGIGIALLATGGGIVAVRMRRDHLDPATR
jgi:hypothetical protein